MRANLLEIVESARLDADQIAARTSKIHAAVLRKSKYLDDPNFTRIHPDDLQLLFDEYDAEFFAINPLAFWKRAQAIREGFESVRVTIEQNYDQLARVLGRYGLEMDRKAARRKAARLREARGWRITEEPPPAKVRETPPLRLVDAKRA